MENRENPKPVVRKRNPSDTLAARYGRRVVDGEDVEPTQFKMQDVECVSLLRRGKKFVRGFWLRQQSTKIGANLGLVDAKYIFDHQSEIPAEYRSKIFVFTGTLLLFPGDPNQQVAVLSWCEGSWRLFFSQLCGALWDNRVSSFRHKSLTKKWWQSP